MILQIAHMISYNYLGANKLKLAILTSLLLIIIIITATIFSYIASLCFQYLEEPVFPELSSLQCLLLGRMHG